MANEEKDTIKEEILAIKKQLEQVIKRIDRMEFGPANARPLNMDMLYFRNDRERYLRRDVIDTYLDGKPVVEQELREAIVYLLNRLSEFADGLAIQLRRPKVDPKCDPRRVRKSLVAW